MSSEEKNALKAEMMALLEESKAQSNDPNLGRITKGDHQILKLIGAGGMGLVYLARDPHSGARAVVKTLQPQFVNEPEVIARFNQEAIILEEMRHAAIPHVKYIDRSSLPWLLVMEYCEGESLAEYLHNNKVQRKNRAFQKALLQAMFAIIDALALGHSKGIIHRDIKPENIIVMKGPNGELFVKLLDFGIAKTVDGPVQTNVGAIIGTPGYISPEQIMNRSVTKASDIYSLGAVFYEIFAGQNFIELNDSWFVMTSQAMNVLHGPQKLKVLPVYIRALVSMMVAMQPEDRFGGMYEVEGALRFVMRQMEIEDRKILQSETEEMGLIIELTTSCQIDGRLEQIGAQRVMKRQFEIKRSEADITQVVPAIQEKSATAQPPQHLPSVDVPIDSLFGASPPTPSNQDFRNSDLGMAVPSAAGIGSSLAPLPPQASVSIVAEPGGGTILGVGNDLAAPRVSQVVPVPEASLTALPVSIVECATKPAIIPCTSVLTPPEAPVKTVIRHGRVKRNSYLFPAGGILVFLSAVAFVLLVWPGVKSGKKNSNSSDKPQDAITATQYQAADNTPDASTPQTVPDAQVVTPPPQVADASVPPSSNVKSFEDTYKTLEVTCKTSDKGQKYWEVPNFRLYCIKLEIFKVEDLEMKLQLLKVNKSKYCRPGLRPYERGSDSECRSHDHWIKDTTDKIWAKNHPDWRPSPRKTPPSMNPSRPKPRR